MKFKIGDIVSFGTRQFVVIGINEHLIEKYVYECIPIHENFDGHRMWFCFDTGDQAIAFTESSLHESKISLCSELGFIYNIVGDNNG